MPSEFKIRNEIPHEIKKVMSSVVAVRPREYLVYFLQAGRQSYIGFTVNMTRRLRQHRGELVGGAKYTSSWPHRRHLKLVACIRGFPTRHSALSYEWHAKRVCSSSWNFSGSTSYHRRLPGFFFPATTAKFRAVQPHLQVTLFHHHELAPQLIQTFELSQVQCLPPL